MGGGGGGRGHGARRLRLRYGWLRGGLGACSFDGQHAAATSGRMCWTGVLCGCAEGVLGGCWGCYSALDQPPHVRGVHTDAVPAAQPVERNVEGPATCFVPQTLSLLQFRP